MFPTENYTFTRNTEGLTPPTLSRPYRGDPPLSSETLAVGPFDTPHFPTKILSDLVCTTISFFTSQIPLSRTYLSFGSLSRPSVSPVFRLTVTVGPLPRRTTVPGV